MPERSEPRLDRSIPRGTRPHGPAGSVELVSVRKLGDHKIPLLVEPAILDFDPLVWVEANRAAVDAWLLEHRAILFRNFGITTPEHLGRFARATSGSEMIDIPDETTPRASLAGKVFASTIYPSDQSIPLHNEAAYCHQWGNRIYFGCIVAPATRGETPIADVRLVAETIGAPIVDEFRRRGIRYVRNYYAGIGLTWQQAFWTESREEVERYCHANQLEFEWDGAALRTITTRPALRRHPITGEWLWFNHAAFFNVEAREESVRHALLDSFGESRLPIQTYYGDGGPIEEKTVNAIMSAYQRHKVSFAWQQGDVLLLDNMTIAHGREPFSGPREIAVALTGACSDSLGE